MKSRRPTILVILVGLLLFAFATGIAQTPPQGDQKKKTEACCSMESCCCNSGSCPMEGGAANAEGKDSCCCKGDSCEMKQDGENHPACCTDSCDMTKHDGKKHDGKASCCKAKAKQKAA